MHSASYKKDQYVRLVRSFKKVRALVVGDVMLDVFTYGTSTRLSPEAPVPVVLFEHECVMPGGAANVARNIASLGGRAKVFGIIGADHGGVRLRALLKEEHVDVSGLVADKASVTTVKQRIVIGGAHALRLDTEVVRKPSEVHARLERLVCKALASTDVLILVDYRKGTLTKRMAQILIREAKVRGIPVVADMKPEHAHFFVGASLVTPNRAEALTMTKVRSVARAGRILVKVLKAAVLITEGADGMSLFTQTHFAHIPARARTVVDVSGAGDTVTAAAALTLARDGGVQAAMAIANAAAAVVVEKHGTAIATAQEVSNILTRHSA